MTIKNINKNKKNIWILNHHAETPSTGTGTRHYDFARELIKRGYRVTIFASSHIHYTDTNLLDKCEKYKIVDESGIQWIWINTMTYTSNGVRRVIGMLQYYSKVQKIAKTIERADVIMGSAVHLLACLAAYKLSKRYKVKCISEIRDLWPETLIQMGRLKRGSIISKLMNLLEDYIYHKSDKIIITAPGMREYIESRGIELDKVVYINNGLDADAFNERCRVKYIEDVQGSLDCNFFNVVYTGGHGLANDLGTAVKAAKILQDQGYNKIRFTFFGEGPLKEELKLLANEMNLTNIVFKGIIPKYCIPKVLKKADVLIVMLKNLDLYKYGMSMNKIFEYLYSGTPIVFAVNVPNDYVAETGDGFSIEPEKPEDMAEAILKLYTMPLEKQKEMGKRGQNFIKENFDIPVLVDKLEEVLFS